jgi:hypothetical protein
MVPNTGRMYSFGENSVLEYWQIHTRWDNLAQEIQIREYLHFRLLHSHQLKRGLPEELIQWLSVLLVNYLVGEIPRYVIFLCNVKFGKLGQGASGTSTPGLITTLSGITDMCASEHSLALTNMSLAYSFGYNGFV